MQNENKSRRIGRFTFLGTGSSGGVPVVSCQCSVCSSTFVKNKRLRTSGLLEVDQKKLLIDVGPDFRTQALRYNLKSLDALFLTHTHYDHVGGLEELRVFTLHQGRKLPCFLSQESLQSLKNLFYYHFEEKEEVSNRSAEFEFHILKGDYGDFVFEGIPFRYVSYFQGTMHVLGFRIGSFAYLTDLKNCSQSLLKELEGVQVLVTSALRFEPSRVQMNVDEAVAFIQKVQPEKAYLIHMSHELDFESLSKSLPPNIQPAYDGLEIQFYYEVPS